MNRNRSRIVSLLLLTLVVTSAGNVHAAEITVDEEVPEEMIVDEETPEEIAADEEAPEEIAVDEEAPEDMSADEKITEDTVISAETDEQMVGAYLPGDLDENTPVYEDGISLYGELPASFPDNLDLSSYPKNRNQNPYGTCWAFSSIGLAEFDLINKGLASGDIDLSELQLAYFTYNSALDPLGGTSGDQSTFSNSSTYQFLNYGGNYEYAVRRLAQWSGAVTEALVPYSQASSVSAGGLSAELAYNQDAWHLRNAYTINLRENTEEVKASILEHGAAGVMYRHQDNAMLWNSEKQLWTYYDTDYRGSGHAVMLVGWDDDFSKENFLGVTKPEQDGAWLVRNSWGDYVSYFWMSYETVSLGTAAWFFDMEDAKEYDHNYQLDGGLHTYYDSRTTHEANVFQVQAHEAKEAESLKAVQLSFTHAAGVGYTIDIYTDLTDPANPLSGTRVSEASTRGETTFAGIYTIDLEEEVPLTPGSYFAVVVSLDKCGLDYEQGITYASGETTVWSCPVTSASGSYYSYNGSSYSPWTMNGNYCIKALTSDTEESTPDPEPEPEPEPTPEPEKSPEEILDALAAEHRNDIADGTYDIRSALNKSYDIDVSGGSRDNYANVQLYEKNDTNAQYWRVSHDSKGYITLTNIGSGKVLDVSGAGTRNGTNIQQFASNQTRAQKWIGVRQTDGSFVFLSALAKDKCMDLSGASVKNGSNIQLYETNNTLAQRWFLSQNTLLDDLAEAHKSDITDGTYTLYSAVNQRYTADVSGGSYANGANVQAYVSNGTNAQRWRVSHDSKGYITLTNIGSGKVLDVSGAGTGNGTNIQQYVSNQTRAQKWIAVKQADGSMVLISALNRYRCMDLSGANASNGSNIQLYETNGTRAQKWYFR